MSVPYYICSTLFWRGNRVSIKVNPSFMKLFIYIFLALSASLLVFNAFNVNFEAPLAGDSFAAVVGVIASLCAIVLLIILQLALKIKQKVKR